MSESKKECIFCQRDDTQVPLVQLSYMQTNYWICPQHIPILIHDPAKLKGVLPGAEDMQPG